MIRRYEHEKRITKATETQDSQDEDAKAQIEDSQTKKEIKSPGGT